MNIYLIRHADAVPLGEGHFPHDVDRPLTPKGHEQAKLVAKALHRHGVQLDAIVTSPLVRAHETAETLHKSLSPAPQLQTCDELAPGGKAKKLTKFVRESGQQAIALVGHQPDLGAYAAWLIGSKKARIDLAKAGVACISFPEEPRKGEGMLQWLVGPEWME
jgi:phosphohistidine phosphatase